MTSASKPAASTPAKSQSLETAAPREQSGAHAGSVGTLTSKPATAATPSPKADPKRPGLKKESSDLFKSFAKAKAKPAKKVEPETDSVDNSAVEDGRTVFFPTPTQKLIVCRANGRCI
jgi:DNA polymerase delta subunit 3